MRLLLDEMYPPTIAAGLRRRGVDVVAVTERPELRNMPDPDLFAAAQAERRAVVTENVRDFVPIANDCDARALAHHGLVLVNPGAYPRGNRRTIGAMVTALMALCREVSHEDATSLRHWL
ncbi:MAG TPA: DUF5615 family PIN-like protein [Conexibacter sp.]|nr:DUF5615 family PIN-like protein [Conexibacter sp.]